MAILYVETSLPMSIAMGRDADAANLLQSIATPNEIVMPAVCVIEALTAAMRERNLHQEFRSHLTNRAIQLRRDLVSAAAKSMVSHIEQARTDADALWNDIQTRLADALEQLCRSATLIQVQPAVVAASFRSQHLKQMTDNLILHMVLADARTRAQSRKAILTGNVNDFQDPIVLQLLSGVGIEGPLATAGEATEWLKRAT